jgi:hypothetical protein
MVYMTATLTASEIERKIVEVVTEIQRMTGHPCPVIDAQTCPLKDLVQFDSQLALLATVELGARLSFEIPDDVNVFVDTEVNRPRRISQIRDEICAMLSPKVTTHGR